ncbi:TPA: glycosyltransferase, partial [Kluyvera georgiana]
NYSQNNDIGKLYLIGKYDTSSSYYKKINKLIKKLNVSDNVILTGSVSDDELKQYYSQSKCFISFSEHEGFGVPLLEAAQHHIPVLALNAAAVSETLDDSPGVFDNEVDAYN